MTEEEIAELKRNLSFQTMRANTAERQLNEYIEKTRDAEYKNRILWRVVNALLAVFMKSERPAVKLASTRELAVNADMPRTKDEFPDGTPWEGRN